MIREKHIPPTIPGWRIGNYGKLSNMVGPSIYSSMFVGIWLEQFYNSLPLWRRVKAKYFGQKIEKKEFEDWLFKRIIGN